MTVRVGLMATLALAFIVAGTGCADNKTSAERAGLLSQNEQYKKELEAERRARQEAEARANMAAAQNTTTPPAETLTPPNMEGGALDLTGPGAPGVTPRTGRTATGDIGGGVTSSRNARGEMSSKSPAMSSSIPARPPSSPPPRKRSTRLPHV